MTWPPHSPDLNPIEMVWDELDRRVKEKQPTSAQHMWEHLEDCWKTNDSPTKRIPNEWRIAAECCGSHAG